MKTYTLSQARASLSALLDAVERGEEVEITRHGRSVARLVHARGARSPRTEDQFAFVDKLRAEMEQARHRPPGPPVEDIDVGERIRLLREDRESR